MGNFIQTCFGVLLSNWQSALVGGLVVVSVVIMIMGLAKKLFNKIPNKNLRKFCLAFASVVLVLPVTAIYFVCAGINYKYFWVGYGMTAVATIITYWLYENTCLRNLINKVGSLTVGKLIGFIIGKIHGGKSSLIEAGEIASLTESLQDDVMKEVQNAVPPVSEIAATPRIPIATVSEESKNHVVKDTDEFKNL